MNLWPGMGLPDSLSARRASVSTPSPTKGTHSPTTTPTPDRSTAMLTSSLGCGSGTSIYCSGTGCKGNFSPGQSTIVVTEVYLLLQIPHYSPELGDTDAPAGRGQLPHQPVHRQQPVRDDHGAAEHRHDGDVCDDVGDVAELWFLL